MPENGKPKVEGQLPPPKPETDEERFLRHTKELQDLTDRHIANVKKVREAAEAQARRLGIPEELIPHSTEVRETVLAEHIKFARAAVALTEKHRAEAPPPPSPHVAEASADHHEEA